jgi:hypothetical protein
LKPILRLSIRCSIGVVLLGPLLSNAAFGAPFGASPVNVPFLSYTGKYEPVTISPVTTQPLGYTGKQAPPLPAVTTPQLHYSGRIPLPAVTTTQLSYTGRGDPKGIPVVNAPTLSYKGKQ